MTKEEKIAQGICPECGGELRWEGGCAYCPICGYSVCGNE